MLRLGLLCASALALVSGKVEDKLAWGVNWVTGRHPPKYPEGGPAGQQVCDPDATECEFWFHITETLPMRTMSYGFGELGQFGGLTGGGVVYAEKGKLYLYNGTEWGNYDGEPMIQDGTTNQRIVLGINRTSPGPTIVTHYGQRIIVHVYNTLGAQSATLHWHGIHQLGTPWYDGVPMVTQCPIPPGMSFTYNFTADHVGTHWYHSHLASQASDGLFGAIIVHPKDHDHDHEEVDHVVVLSDYNHDQYGDDWTLEWEQGGGFIGWFGEQPTGAKWSNANWLKLSDHNKLGPQMATSGLINGKGRYFTGNNVHLDGSEYDPTTESPLTVYEVDSSALHHHRFRVVGVASWQPWRLSVDHHKIKIVSADGEGLEPVVVESIVVHPGERWDFYLDSSDAPAGLTSFYIRSRSLEIEKLDPMTGLTVEINVTGLAIIHYSDANDEANQFPDSHPHACDDEGDPCYVLNCPFPYWRDAMAEYVSTTTLCLNPTENMIASEETLQYYPPPGEPDKTFFLGLGFQNDAAINAKNFEEPIMPVLTQPDGAIKKLCDYGNTTAEVCTHVLQVDLGDTVEFVLMGRGGSHPMHIHGGSASVLYTGYATYNESGYVTAPNPDVDPVALTWNPSGELAKSQWNMINPPAKDQFVIPYDGYVVIRYVANNPGIWAMHCHQNLHAHIGMLAVLNVSSHLAPPPPAGFPKCYNFDEATPRASEGCGGLGACSASPGSHCVPEDPTGIFCCAGSASCTNGVCTQECHHTDECGEFSYCSPNMQMCMPRGMHGAYCNVVKLCNPGLTCTDKHCHA